MSETFENGVYSFKDVHLSISGPNLQLTATGVAEEGYTVEFDDDVGSLVIGADGSGQHSLRAGQSGTISLTLFKTSTLNRAFCNAYNYQRSSAAYYGRNTIVITDTARGDVINGAGCAFHRFPNISYAIEGGMQTWAFKCTRVIPLLGLGTGNLISG